MNVVPYIIVLGTLILCCSCMVKDTPEYYPLICKATREANAPIKKEGYIRFGTGGSCYSDLRLNFEDYISYKTRLTSVDEARIFIVEKAEGYLKTINDCKEVRPYLHNYPFTATNLVLSFNFYDKQDKPLMAPFLSEVYVNAGRIIYEMRDTKSPIGRNIHKETYDEALAIYKEYMKKNPKSSSPTEK